MIASLHVRHGDSPVVSERPREAAHRSCREDTAPYAMSGQGSPHNGPESHCPSRKLHKHGNDPGVRRPEELACPRNLIQQL